MGNKNFPMVTGGVTKFLHKDPS